jgi:endonuclease/exonuclease/phosphatase (EEP) superfamily protein YafD
VGRRAVAVVASCLVAGCATVPAEDRAFVASASGTVEVRVLPCPPSADAWRESAALPGDRPLRLVSWNIHKNEDTGWEADLARFAAGADLVLLQEARLDPALQSTLMAATLQWLQADSWRYRNLATGVLTATRAPPAAACVARAMEPLLGLPKSALVTWHRLAGRADLLAVANLHSVNFSLALDGYRSQLDAVAAVLATHRGPVVFAGDFNTWNVPRIDVLEEVMRNLGLVRVDPDDDRRTRFVGLPADYVFVRGLARISAHAEPVTSSDHAPLLAELVLLPERP